MKKYQFLVVVLFLCLTQCGRKEDETVIRSFPQKFSFPSSTIKIPVDILMPAKVMVVNDKFVVYDHNSKSSPFKVFSIPSLAFKYAYGTRGQGPGEFSFVAINSLKNSKQGLEVVDGETFKLFQVTDDSLKQIYSMPLPRSIGNINGLQRMNDSIFFVDNMLSENELYEHFIVNSTRERVVGQFGEFPDDGMKFNEHSIKYQVYIKAGIAKPDRSKFATFYYNFNQFKIYDSEGKLLKKVFFDDGNNKTYDLANQKNNPIYNAEPVATDKYIYVLGVEKTKKEVEQNIEAFKPHVKVWDWDGNPIADIQLDKPVISFAVSETDGELYGMSFVEANEIYKYDISEFLLNKSSLSTSPVPSTIFKAEIFQGWQNAEPEKKVDEWIEQTKEQILMNKNIYVSNEDDRCGSSVWFTVSKNSGGDVAWPQTYLKNYSMKGSGIIDYNTFYDTISNKPTRVFRYKFEATEPSGEKYLSNAAEWLWIEENNVIQVKFFSCDNFQTLYGDVEKIVKSFKLKTTR